MNETSVISSAADPEIAELRARLREAEETIDAIRNGEVDALVVNRGDGTSIYTLENADRPYRLLVERMQEGALTLSSDGRILYANRRFAEFLGATPESVLGVKLSDYASAEHRRKLDMLIGLAQNAEVRAEVDFIDKRGAPRPAQISLATLPGDAGPVTCAIVSDLTDILRQTKQLQDVNAKLVSEIRDREIAESQLRQAQKMEAVGQLTGGLAHDFNNMLAIVMGALNLLARRLKNAEPQVTKYIEAAQEGAQRAAQLTQRLLAFSRRQALAPAALDPAQMVQGMSELLRGTLGRAIVLETVTEGGAGLIFADPGQLENVIVNIALNARDAMPDGGKLLIETQNVDLDESAAAHADTVPGRYVLISFTDTGCGIPADIIGKVFDPFFTTKGVGKGTGLGLSQVYGFVKQSGGHIKICSPPAGGTSIKIYLPRHMEAASDDGVLAPPSAAVSDGQQELILVVDDEPAVRSLAADALRELGYRAIQAADGAAALRLIEQHPEIDLLLTDIVMPDLNGRMLADRAHQMRPDLKVLYMTGFTRDAVVHNGVLDAGVHLLAKPFTIEELSDKIRAVLAEQMLSQR